MAWALRVIGVILILAGGIWFFQGIGVILGSFMTGQPLWAAIGAGCVVVGVVLLLLASRARGRKAGGG